jgi:hypothetical protein
MSDYDFSLCFGVLLGWPGGAGFVLAVTGVVDVAPWNYVCGACGALLLLTGVFGVVFGRAR